VRDLLERNATKLRALHADIHNKVALRDKSDVDRKAWRDACAEFHSAYDALAFPGGLAQAIELLKSGDLITAETAILYCEIRPYYFRSGYHRTKLVRLLKRINLPSPLAIRLHRITEEMHRRKLANQPALADRWRLGPGSKPN